MSNARRMKRNSQRLDGKVAVVTGASMGYEGALNATALLNSILDPE
jgi:hypothetical protein